MHRLRSIPPFRTGGLLVAVLLAPVHGLAAQDEPGAVPSDETIRVYLDFQTFGRDFDFYRRAIPWVSWVRDRRDADVHLLITSRETGGGGRAFEVAFLGRGRFEEREVRREHFTEADATADERRQGLARVFRRGLLPFVEGLPVADRLEISFGGAGEAAEGEAEAGFSPADDPWNLWVFRIRLGGSFEGQSSIRSTSLNGSASASRTTEEWKVRFAAAGRHREEDFDTGERTVTSLTRELNSSVTVVNTLGARWGGGFRLGVNSATRRNQDLAFSLGPALEFNVFPYDESSRRSLTLQYRLTPNHFRYDEETIFGRLEETRVDQALRARLSLRQPWGTATVSLEGAHYLHDPERNRLTFFSGLNLRLFRGFSLNVFGRYSRIRDQLHLPRGDASEEEVLLRIRDLETDFDYDLNVGFEYTFGSIYNNIVNPRLDSFGGGFFFFF